MRRWVILLALVASVAAVSLLTVRFVGGGSGQPEALVETDLKAVEPGIGVLEGSRAEASGVAGAPAQGQDVAPPLPEIDDRKIVRQAQMELEVQDVLKAVQAVETIAANAGGFVASSNIFSEEPPPPKPRPLEEGAAPPVERGERTQTATITIRVPASRYQGVVSDLRSLAAEVRGESSSTSDVSGEYADLQARLRNLQASEARLLELLSRATSIGDILVIQDRINAVRLESERIQGRINLLNNLTDLATIDVHLRPFVAAEKLEGEGWAQEVAEEAWEGSQAVLQALGRGAIVGGIVLAWLAVPGLVAFTVWRLRSPRRLGGGQA